jgi:general secretion pathway protein D
MNRSVWSLVLSLVVATALSGPALAAGPDDANDPAATKIRLLSEALQARDAGDIATARTNLQQLLVLAPNDETVKRLLASLDRPTQKKVTVSGGTVAEPAPTMITVAAEADQLARAEEQRQARLLEAAGAAGKEARALAKQGHYSEALAVVDRAITGLPENNLTKPAHADLAAARTEILAARDSYLTAAARPAAPPAEVPAPAAAPANGEVAELLKRGRSQYLISEPTLAAQTFAKVLELDPANAEAKDFLRRIAAGSTDQNPNRTQTTAQMLNEVERAWQRPGVFNEKPLEVTNGPAGPSPLLEKLNHIVLPTVNFSGMELSRVVNTLSAVSEEFDQTGTGPKGVNIVLIDPANANPAVNITLRNLPLKRVLDFITNSVGYQYEVQADAIVVRPGGEQTTLDTQFFAVSRSTVLRMTGRGAQGPAAEPVKGAATTATPADQSAESEGDGIKKFFTLAGVTFGEGSSLAFDGSQLIATQTPRNLERIRNILRRYNDVRQVEIEAKFMEVQEGVLDELGVQWNVAKKATQQSGATVTDYLSSNRSIADAFASNTAGVGGSIVQSVTSTNTVNGVTTATTGLNTTPIIDNPPPIPGTNNLGTLANPLASITGILGEFNVNAVVRALSQKSGTELLSAPKLTVLSGNQANITVAQELRYPQSYGQVQSQVGTGSASGGGSAGVTITAGTPQEFTTRNVGVELKVTPTVEEDDYSISLDLNPKVTEFEGFVEYGGQSLAISGGTTVTVPSGFYQPIFGVREMNTKVTIWDGATLVMGGLTREDVKKVNDKVPVLGSLPLVGRLFRSDGESSQKRNLLIFVTANLVSPGGSLKKQDVSGVTPGSLYQNPTIVTPAGATLRTTPKG